MRWDQGERFQNNESLGCLRGRSKSIAGDSLDRLYELLESISREVEKRIKSELSGFCGTVKESIYNRFVPVVINILTEERCYHMIFLRGGSISLQKGRYEKPDITISALYEELERLLQNREFRSIMALERQGRVKLRAHTPKGERVINGIKQLIS